MKGFEDVTIGWRGDTFTVPADRQLMLIAEIEDALTVGSKTAMEVLLSPSGPGHAKLSMAYGAALRFAGADVSNDEIYLSIMNDLANRDVDAVVKVQSAVMALISIISPPIAFAISEMGDDEKKSEAAE